jgi:hypothetical protein
VGIAEREGTLISFRAFTRFGVVVAAGTLIVSTAWLSVYVFLGKSTADWSALGLAMLAGAFRIARRLVARRRA